MTGTTVTDVTSATTINETCGADESWAFGLTVVLTVDGQDM